MSKTKYICTKCGAVIDEDDLDAVMQWDGEGVMGGYHPVEDKCPECGGTDVVEAEECCCCGECFDKENDMIEVDDFWYCKECAGRIHDAYWATWGAKEGEKVG